jgi:hypothetical protein
MHPLELDNLARVKSVGETVLKTLDLKEGTTTVNGVTTTLGSDDINLAAVHGLNAVSDRNRLLVHY